MITATFEREIQHNGFEGRGKLYSLSGALYGSSFVVSYESLSTVYDGSEFRVVLTDSDGDLREPILFEVGRSFDEAFSNFVKHLDCPLCGKAEKHVHAALEIETKQRAFPAEIGSLVQAALASPSARHLPDSDAFEWNGEEPPSTVKSDN